MLATVAVGVLVLVGVFVGRLVSFGVKVTVGVRVTVGLLEFVGVVAGRLAWAETRGTAAALTWSAVPRATSTTTATTIRRTRPLDRGRNKRIITFILISCTV